MTPLAYRIVRDAIDDKAIRILMADVHCFECTEVIELAKILCGTFSAPAEKIIQTRHLVFLPAPKTWLEFNITDQARHAFLLEQDSALVKVTLCEHELGSDKSIFIPCGWINPETMKLLVERDVPALFALALDDDPDSQRKATGWSRLVFALLVLINSPKIIGRRQHMPNRTLEAKLVKRLGRGQFPLHAWSTIKLEVSKPPEIDDGEPHEAHLTGKRALHFCRAHLRIRLGQLEYVSSHWRGDPSVGVRQSRYSVVP